MSNREICQYCKSSVKDKYSLKNHLSRNKACLKLRGLSLNTKFTCKGCKNAFLSNADLVTHIETCKQYIILKVKEECNEEYKEEVTKLKEEINFKEKCLFDSQIQIENIHKSHKKNISDIQLHYQELQKISDKALLDAHNQIDKLQKMLENIAIKGVDKPTTTNITNIRNSFSDKYFVEDIKEADIKRKCQSFLTEEILMEGQRGIARLCTEHIINTNDKKKILIATDPSRNKFRYMDKNGNMKDDIEARTFIEKVSKPIKEIAGIVFDNVLSDIKDEQETIEENDYGRKAHLHDKEMQANHSLVYINCFDDPKHNSEFTSELAILNKSK